MWALPSNYGDNPMPRRYFLREPVAVVVEAEKSAKEPQPAKRNDWHRFLLILMRALAPFPEAKDAVVAAFRGASP
jgi:hypothetical protein